MTLVSPQQSNPGETIEASDINNPVNALATVINGQIDSTNISSVSGAKVQAGTLNASAMDTATNVETRLSESLGDFVASGLVWSQSSGLNGTMTAGVAYVSGKRLVVSSIASRAFTASKDTYVSLDSSGTVSYSEVANNAASPALPANSIWVAKVVTSGSSITSVSLAGLDSNNKTIYPRRVAISVSVSTDANGWIVYDYGNCKVATKTLSSTAAKVRFEQGSQSSGNLPVGVNTVGDLKSYWATVENGNFSDFVTITRQNNPSSAGSLSFVYLYMGPTTASSYTVPIKFNVIF